VSVPAPPAGVAPEVGLSYAAQVVDGLTSDENTQGGKLGAGWSMGEAFIERRFTPCNLVQNPDTTFPWSIADLCWVSPAGFVSFGGVSGRLVPVGAGETQAGWSSTLWRLEDDAGWRFESRVRTSSVRGGFGVDNDGEHWVVTAPDGTRYWFGYGREAGAWAPGDTLRSVQTVPVFGLRPGDPCYAASPSNGSDSWCHQGYRWSLDRVEDANGRVITYRYAQEQNHYGRFGGSASTPYVSAERLERIEYGQVNRNAGVAGANTHEVVFSYDFRCVSPGACVQAPTRGNGAEFPDIPVDHLCGSSGCGKPAPVFFDRHKLVGIGVWARHPGGNQVQVSREVLQYQWRDGDGSGPDPKRLWLAQVQHVGTADTDPVQIGLPPVQFFAGTALANRADPNPDAGVGPMRWYRIDLDHRRAGPRDRDRLCAPVAVCRCGFTRRRGVAVPSPVVFRPLVVTAVGPGRVLRVAQVCDRGGAGA